MPRASSTVPVKPRADVELANATIEADLPRVVDASRPQATVRRIEAIMTCRERLPASAAPPLAVEEMTLALAR
jgi:DNA polymerase-3 subunit delta'